MLKGFKEFILKGNVVELATAVIIGAAFTGIVTAFTSSIIQPLFAAIPTGDCDNGTTETMTSGTTSIDAPIQSCPFGVTLVSGNDATFMDFGALLTAIINFLIVAAVVYFLIIVPYNRLSALGGFGKKAEVSEISLLTEIRDLLDPEGTSAAKEAAEKELPDHLTDDGPDSGDTPPGGDDTPGTQRIAVPPAPPAAPAAPAGYEPQGGFPTPQPGPGNYPAPGNYPPPQGYQPGTYPPGYRGELPPDGPGRHSR